MTVQDYICHDTILPIVGRTSPHFSSGKSASGLRENGKYLSIVFSHSLRRLEDGIAVIRGIDLVIHYLFLRSSSLIFSLEHHLLRAHVLSWISFITL
jgi:hypothetical protein